MYIANIVLIYCSFIAYILLICCSCIALILLKWLKLAELTKLLILLLNPLLCIDTDKESNIAYIL